MGSYGRHGGRAAVSTRTVSCPCHVDACRRLHVDMIIAPTTTTTTASSMPPAGAALHVSSMSGAPL
jgi:hypothetical protein